MSGNLGPESETNHSPVEPTEPTPAHAMADRLVFARFVQLSLQATTEAERDLWASYVQALSPQQQDLWMDILIKLTEEQGPSPDFK